MSFLKKHRLRTKKQFDEIFKRGKSIRGSFYLAKYIPNNLSNSRFTIMVSKKIVSGAVARNKMRRRIREAWRMYGGLSSAFDIIFNIQKPTNLSSLEIQKEMRDLNLPH